LGFGTWNVRSLYRAGSLAAAVRELARYKLDVRGKAMANYPQEFAQDAVCQSHTGHMTGLWFLPARPLRLNIHEGMNE
jgi:hypothetical protein